MVVCVRFRWVNEADGSVREEKFVTTAYFQSFWRVTDSGGVVLAHNRNQDFLGRFKGRDGCFVRLGSAWRSGGRRLLGGGSNNAV